MDTLSNCFLPRRLLQVTAGKGLSGCTGLALIQSDFSGVSPLVLPRESRQSTKFPWNRIQSESVNSSLKELLEAGHPQLKACQTM